MKKYFLLSLGLLLFQAGFAQPIPREAIEDSVLGWMKVYHFKGARTGMKVENKVYSIAQMSICDSFANWMQASYIPKGGLGDVTRSVSGKLGLYNQNDAALPPSYGAYAKTYIELKYSGGKRVPLSNSHERWSIMANAPVGIPADALCTPTQYYFTLPSFQEQGYSEDLPRLYGLAKHPNTKKYFTYFRRNSAIGNEKTVVLYKDRLPFVKISKGEYLRVIEAAITMLYEKEKRSILEKEKGNQRSIDYFMKYLNEKNEKRIATLKANKERYQNRLEEVAEIFTDQPDVMLENYPDVFEGNGGGSLRLPVYKIDPIIADLCKTDAPQWITITWHGDVTSPVGKHQHESIINNFNFDYVYQFFFEPQKVKGQPYRPLRPPSPKETTAVTEASDLKKKADADRNVFYFEDFSTTEKGKKPLGWKAILAADGTTGLVAAPAGLSGNWVELRGHHIKAIFPKLPMPQNFTLSYDLVAAQNFAWGAKGLTMQLSKETSPGNAESFLKLRLRPGYSGRDGEAVVETNFPAPPGYSKETKWFTAAGFSNDKTYNRISISIKKVDEALLVFIDNVKIAGYDKAIPAAHLFNALSFDCSGNRAETDKYLISNIRITKD